MSEHNLDAHPPKEAFQIALEALKEEADHRGWMDTYRELLQEIEAPQVTPAEGYIDASVKFRVKSQFSGEIGTRLNDLFGDSSYINVVRTLHIPTKAASASVGCSCPTEVHQFIKDYTNDLIAEELRMGHVAWVQVEGTPVYQCDANDCNNR